MKRIKKFTAQRVNCLFNFTGNLLEGEKGVSSLPPSFEIFLDDNTNQILFRITDIDFVTKRSTNPGERLDVYLDDGETKIFIEEINKLYDTISSKVTFARGLNIPTDPRPTYDGKGLMINISKPLGNIKIQSISSTLFSLKVIASYERINEVNKKPMLCFDLEPYNKSFRLHFGVPAKWKVVKSPDVKDNSVIIALGWSEYANLLTCLRGIK